MKALRSISTFLLLLGSSAWAGARMHSMRLALVLILVLLGWNHSDAATSSAYKVAVRARLEPLPPGTITIGGHLGHKLSQCITNRIMVQEINPMLGLFLRSEEHTSELQS